MKYSRGDRPSTAFEWYREVRDRVNHKDSPLAPTERLVAGAIGDHMNNEGVAFCSLRAIHEWTGLHTRTVENVVEILCGDGPKATFTRESGGSPAGGTRMVNFYRLRHPSTSGVRPGVTSGRGPGVGRGTSGLGPGEPPVLDRTTSGPGPHDPRSTAGQKDLEGPIEGQLHTPLSPLSRGRGRRAETHEQLIRRCRRAVQDAAHALGIETPARWLKAVRRQLDAAADGPELAARRLITQLREDVEDEQRRLEENERDQRLFDEHFSERDQLAEEAYAYVVQHPELDNHAAYHTWFAARFPTASGNLSAFSAWMWRAFCDARQRAQERPPPARAGPQAIAGGADERERRTGRPSAAAR